MQPSPLFWGNLISYGFNYQIQERWKTQTAARAVMGNHIREKPYLRHWACMCKPSEQRQTQGAGYICVLSLGLLPSAWVQLCSWALCHRAGGTQGREQSAWAWGDTWNTPTCPCSRHTLGHGCPPSSHWPGTRTLSFSSWITIEHYLVFSKNVKPFLKLFLITLRPMQINHVRVFHMVKLRLIYT